MATGCRTCGAGLAGMGVAALTCATGRAGMGVAALTCGAGRAGMVGGATKGLMGVGVTVVCGIGAWRSAGAAGCAGAV